MSRYNANVRVGNWFNEMIMQEELLQQYIRKNENSDLQVQKARKLFLSMLVEVPLTFPVRGLSFGAVVQIMAKDAPNEKRFMLEKGQGMVLSANINYVDIDRRSVFSFEDPVIATGLLTPCVRNVWTMVPVDPSKKGEPIRYGDSFYMQLYSSELPLYLEVSSPGPTAIRGECGEVTPKLVGFPSCNSRFTVVHLYSTYRYETEGEIVPAFERVILLHGSSAQALAIEDETWIPTYFGMECEVSIKNYFVDTKRPFKHDYKNFWCFMLSSV